MQPTHQPGAAEENRLLRALPADQYARILDHLEPVEFSARHVLWQPNAVIHSLYFPRTCVVSLLTPLSDEQPVESATVGREGMAGTAVVLGVRMTNTHALVQVPGSAARMDARRFLEQERHNDGVLFSLLLRYAQVLLEQTSQSVACNRRHSIEERCARWLLMTHDRVGADEFPLTQDFLAFMLGVRRASVTVAAGMLQQAGLIRYRRGRIAILDREGLEAASCECYAVIERNYERLFGNSISPKR
jgi:CRP-like cAMP-binding protein